MWEMKASKVTLLTNVFAAQVQPDNQHQASITIMSELREKQNLLPALDVLSRCHAIIKDGLSQSASGRSTTV